MKLHAWYLANAHLHGQKAKALMESAALNTAAARWTWIDNLAYQDARLAGHFGRLALGETSERAA